VSEKKEILINCGISHVSASIFTFDGKKITLQQTALQNLNYDYSNDQHWLGAVISGLEKLCKKLNLKGDARFIFPGSLLLNKTLRVPHVEEEKQKKIVAFELSQKMPFPLSELIWDYQVIDDDGVEQEILAFAVKPEVAESFCEKVVEIGLSPVQITPAPVLDYNALISSGIGIEEEETLVVNIGAKSTNLLFINPTGFLIRSIAVGGNTLTQNISDNLGILFERAEEVKKSYFTGQVAFSPEDPSVQVLQKCSQQFLTRATQEITRSIVTYKRLKKGKTPTRIFLSGRGALLNNLPEYLSQSQGLNIDYFDPLQSVLISNQIDEQTRSLLPFIIGEPIGLASSLFGIEKSKEFKSPLNLLPASKITNLNFKKKVPILLFSAALLSCFPLIGFTFKSTAITKLEKELLNIKKESRTLEAKISENEFLKNKHVFTENINRLILKRNNIFVSKTHSCWLIQDFLNQLQSSLNHPEVKDAWFDEVRFEDQTTSTNSRSPIQKSISTKKRVTLIGRYLVRTSQVFDENQNNEKRNHLIELNSKKQEALTQYLESLPFIEKINTKTFSIEGEGDLFTRYFTHFKYIFTPVD
jgi:type IV pilus assembly protein PilM